jgi:hypothetical protein
MEEGDRWEKGIKVDIQYTEQSGRVVGRQPSSA